ncbi:MAG: DUF389 domain-containing protein [Candidatus Kapaibacterium sp.]|nr:DUF389 domain-containing protein [Bacteroidota bacterium]
MFRNLFNLHIGEEKKSIVLEYVKGNVSFTGANLWILACAIIIASIGLNVNSTAVIIGAMLISPLMGPIVGAGFALGTFDFTLLKKSIANLAIATFVSLIVATLYFTVSPFKDAQSEILSRTSPNIYDVLIAFFGGVVGVIAITRVEKGNPIPGVAIATALMPPLCTAGFGIATGQINYFLGALFLYSINCVFICIATYTIVKYLKYPAVKQIDAKQEKQIHFLIYGIVVSMLLPSVYFAYTLLEEQQFRKNAELYIEREFIDKGNILVFKKLNYASSSQRIEVGFLKRQYSEEEKKNLKQRLSLYSLDNTDLDIKESVNNIDQIKNDILNEVSKKEQQLAEIEKNLNMHTFDSKQIFQEANSLFPSISAISISVQTFAYKDSTQEKHVLIYKSTSELSDKDSLMFNTWIKQKLNTNNVEVLRSK